MANKILKDGISKNFLIRQSPLQDTLWEAV